MQGLLCELVGPSALLELMVRLARKRRMRKNAKTVKKRREEGTYSTSPLSKPKRKRKRGKGSKESPKRLP